MKTLRYILTIRNTAIALDTIQKLLMVFGAIGVFEFTVTLPLWTWPISIFSIVGLFYSAYYFNIGFRERRLSEFRYERKSR